MTHSKPAACAVTGCAPPLAVMEAVAEVLCPGERIALLDRIIDLHKSCRRDRDRDSAPGFAYDHDHDHDHDVRHSEDTLMAESAKTNRPRSSSASTIPGSSGPSLGQGQGPPTPPSNQQPRHSVGGVSCACYI
jgi:hypothetical protein